MPNEGYFTVTCALPAQVSVGYMYMSYDGTSATEFRDGSGLTPAAGTPYPVPAEPALGWPVTSCNQPEPMGTR